MSLGYTYHNKLTNPSPQLKNYSAIIVDYITLLANEPFITQAEVAKDLALSKTDLIRLNSTVRNDTILQASIKNDGIGSKYWNNTIMPLFATGKLQASIDKKHTYPERIGLYTGFSCMFYCNFCGRNYNEKYERQYGTPSFDMFKRIIDSDPKDDINWRNRFRISGGVEPLTNRLTNDVIAYGAMKGFNMQLYTNGFLLSDSYIDKNLGILDLAMIRFSIYGIDAETTNNVTKNAKAYDTVLRNIKNLLNRNDLKPTTNVGLNYILLPGKINEIFGVLDYIRDINKNSTRGVDFITIREDHSQDLIAISHEERTRLVEMLHQVDVITKTDTHLKNVHFDYGYALDSLRHNKVTGPLKMVKFNEMIREGFPQVCLSVDIKSDVYLYHESGFIGRPGVERYVIGNIADSTLDNVCNEWVSNNNKINPLPGDTGYLDAFDHVASILINQYRSNNKFGISIDDGPIKIINENKSSRLTQKLSSK
jgi:dTDP-4-amino-4,6-dideoxy-D-glucose ammonia-lyase